MVVPTPVLGNMVNGGARVGFTIYDMCLKHMHRDERKQSSELSHNTIHPWIEF